MLMATPPTSIPVNRAPQGTLPAEYIKGIKARLDERERLFAELPALIENDRKLYAAALLFAPLDFDPDGAAASGETEKPAKASPKAKALGSPKKDKGKGVRKPRPNSWRALIQRHLDETRDGTTHKDLLNAIRRNHNMPISDGEKGFYNAVGKGLQAGEIVKRSGYLYSAKIVQELEHKGALPPEQPAPPRTGQSTIVTKRVLQKYPEGIAGPALKKLVAAEPDAPKSMREHGQYIYNVLGAMIGMGIVVKKDNLYVLVANVGGAT